MSHFNDELFTKVCTLEAKLELNEKKLWELEKLLKQALEIIIDTNKVANGIQETYRKE
jgi:precorrin isomerase